MKHITTLLIFCLSSQLQVIGQTIEEPLKLEISPEQNTLFAGLLGIDLGRITYKITNILADSVLIPKVLLQETTDDPYSPLGHLHLNIYDSQGKKVKVNQNVNICYRSLSRLELGNRDDYKILLKDESIIQKTEFLAYLSQDFRSSPTTYFLELEFKYVDVIDSIFIGGNYTSNKVAITVIPDTENKIIRKYKRTGKFTNRMSRKYFWQEDKKQKHRK